MKKDVMKWWHKVLYLLIIGVAFFFLKWPTATFIDWLGAVFLALIVVNYNTIQSWLLGDRSE